MSDVTALILDGFLRPPQTQGWGDTGEARWQSEDVDKTCGPFDTEKASVAFLIERLGECGGFSVMREVTGRLQSIHPQSKGTGEIRIDAILSPGPSLMERGWPHGFIGIECKRSGEKIGPPLSQMLDYKHSVFRWRNRSIMLDYVLLWPWFGSNGPIGSICAQQRLGAAAWHPYRGGEVILASHTKTLAVISKAGVQFTEELAQGRKVGSR